MGSVLQKWQCDATGQNQLFESDGLGQWDVGDVVINACACEYPTAIQHVPFHSIPHEYTSTVSLVLQRRIRYS
jgi:hypothetical protein